MIFQNNMDLKYRSENILKKSMSFGKNYYQIDSIQILIRFYFYKTLEITLLSKVCV